MQWSRSTFTRHAGNRHLPRGEIDNRLHLLPSHAVEVIEKRSNVVSFLEIVKERLHRYTRTSEHRLAP